MRAKQVLMGVAMLAGFAAPASASPAGVWEFETKDTRVEVEMCGDGQDLCGTLVWLKDTRYNKQYERYLDTVMVGPAKPKGEGRWGGKMNMFGYNASGTIKQRSEDHLTLEGCVALVVCKTYELYRYEE